MQTEKDPKQIGKSTHLGMHPAIGTCSSTDILVEILLRLPPSARRRARLVCRLWRDVVGRRTGEMQSRAKPLLWDTRTATAYVVDGAPSSPCSRELWRTSSALRFDLGHDLQLVGTCNGLLCLCDNGEGRTGGAVSLVNPATGETLPVRPLLPRACRFTGPYTWKRWDERWDKAYGFAYHPTSVQYKVVHVPCRFDPIYESHAVKVLTLGKGASWREVPFPGGATCNLDAGIVSVDGVTHWVTEGGGAARVASFDLGDERVDSDLPLPALPDRPSFNLTEVGGRLGVVIRSCWETTVWVLAEKRWSCRGSLESCRRLPRPQFAFPEFVLKYHGSTLYVYPFEAGVRRGEGQPLESGDAGRQRIMYETSDYTTFAYVETTEPLSYTAN